MLIDKGRGQLAILAHTFEPALRDAARGVFNWFKQLYKVIHKVIIN